MRANTILFWILAAFFGIAASLYGFWTWIDDSDPGMEPAGTVALALTTVLAAFIAFYLGRVHKAQGAELPEDRLDANIDDGDAELGFFSPWSWWPIMLAASAASLDNMPPQENLVLGVSLFHHRWEDTAGLPNQIIMQAVRKRLLEARGNPQALEAALKVQEF